MVGIIMTKWLKQAYKHTLSHEKPLKIIKSTQPNGWNQNTLLNQSGNFPGI